MIEFASQTNIKKDSKIKMLIDNSFVLSRIRVSITNINYHIIIIIYYLYIKTITDKDILNAFKQIFKYLSIEKRLEKSRCSIL